MKVKKRVNILRFCIDRIEYMATSATFNVLLRFVLFYLNACIFVMMNYLPVLFCVWNSSDMTQRADFHFMRLL